MATAAFRSTTRRAEDASSGPGGGRARRSRSLSRPPHQAPGGERTPGSRFVNKTRGSGGFTEISLDDLADEFFRARAESEDEDDDGDSWRWRGQPGRRSSVARSGPRAQYARETEASRQRGRSVSRAPAERGRQAAAPVTVGAPASRGRAQRYASVGPRQSRDSESDIEHSNYSKRRTQSKPSTGSIQKNPSHKQAFTNHARRPSSQRAVFVSNGSGSSHSSLTDDETQGIHHDQISNKKENHIVMYEAMRQEVRCAVEEIRNQLEKVMSKPETTAKVGDNDPQPIEVIAELRRNYASKLELSEKRKQELLAELAAEEQRGQELTKMVKELLPAPRNSAAPERQSRSRRKSNDRTRVSRRLTEEAERYIVDFLSNVEDTDFSSFDGDRSDSSSIKGAPLTCPALETQVDITKVASVTADEDDVKLPWLKWETSNDLQTSPYKNRVEAMPVGGAEQQCSADRPMSSRGSWSPGDQLSSAPTPRDNLLSRFTDVGSTASDAVHNKPTSSSFSSDEYLQLQHFDDIIFERWRERERISSGSLVLCGRWMTIL